MLELKRQRNLIIVLILTIFFTQLWILESINDNIDEIEPTSSSLDALTQHDSIVILSNEDFENQGWSGDGTEGNPYLIEGLNISTDNHCITIEGTTAHFIISNCYLSSENQLDYVGVYLNQVENGTVRNCHIEGKSYGIWIQDSTNILVNSNVLYEIYCGLRLYSVSNSEFSMNNVTTTSYHSLFIYDCHNSSFSRNRLVDSDENGYYFAHCSYIQITNDYITKTGVYAIWAIQSRFFSISSINANENMGGFYLNSLNHSVVLGNTISYCNYSGITVGYGFNISVSGNTITDVNPFGFWSGRGISFDCTVYSEIVNNTVFNATYNGMRLLWSSDCIIEENRVSQSKQCGLLVRGSNDSLVARNDYSDNGWEGVMIDQSSSNCSLVENNFTRNHPVFDLWIGVGVYTSDSCTMDGNLFEQNNLLLAESTDCDVVSNVFHFGGLQVDGISLTDHLHNVTDNSGNGKSIGYNINITDATFDAADHHQLFFVNCSRISVQNGTFSNTSIGIQFAHSMNCVLLNNTVNNASRYGFSVVSSEGCTLENNTCIDCHYGFNILNSENCSVSSNNVSRCYFGIIMTETNETKLNDNLVSDNSGVGLYMYHSRDCMVTANDFLYHHERAFFVCYSENISIHNNIFTNSGLDFKAAGLSHFLHNVTDNTVNGKPIGFFVNTSDGIIEGENYGQVFVVNSDRMVIQNGDFSNTSLGIQIAYSDQCIVRNNNVTRTMQGIHIEHSTDFYIENNSIERTTRSGFLIMYCENITLTTNDIQESNRTSFSIYHSYDCILSNNSGIINRWAGLHLYYCDNFSVSYNTFSNGSQCGIELRHTINSEIIGNKISGNHEFGISLDTSSSENNVYYNQLWLNWQNAIDEGTSNTWDDNVSLGNFWDDYVGIGDYSVSGSVSSVDRFPRVHNPVLPSLSEPDDMEYELGSTGHTLTWQVSHTLSCTYIIQRNGTLVSSDEVNNGSITIDVDNLGLGTYIYTILVEDVIQYSASDIVVVSVVDTTLPMLDYPDDIEYQAGSSGYQIVWISFDLSPRIYQIFRNSELIESGTWNQTSISVDINNLEPGVYNYTLVVADHSGNAASDTVMVTVTSERTSTTTSTTSTETTDTTESEITDTTDTPLPLPSDDIALTIIAFGGLFAIVVVIVIVIMKRRPSG